MNKIVKIILIFIVIGAVLVLGYFGYKKITAGGSQPGSDDYEWVTVDEYYSPKDYVEEFIKKDSAEKGLFPVYIKNYGKNAAVLRKFRGSNFAGPADAQLKMMYKGLEDWMLIDLKYKTKTDREVFRTVLYVYVDGAWKVGDSGSLAK